MRKSVETAINMHNTNDRLSAYGLPDVHSGEATTDDRKRSYALQDDVQVAVVSCVMTCKQCEQNYDQDMQNCSYAPIVTCYVSELSMKNKVLTKCLKKMGNKKGKEK